ncbi:MAG: hypothetical protein GY894_04815 [Planctomycetes bacterium]|jgi:hypothetical protein|nr:hypothetical protein [Planctomycetota bacterium]MCP4838667.1 hypothetical protein [Planctomycetota bacterium]
MSDKIHKRFDRVASAQAAHWFDMSGFAAEAVMIAGLYLAQADGQWRINQTGYGPVSGVTL